MIREVVTMDSLSTSPASCTEPNTETGNISGSVINNNTAVMSPDDPTYCDDLLNDNKAPNTDIDERDSLDSYSSCSNADSEESEIIAVPDQDINMIISKTIEMVLFPENLEIDEEQEEEVTYSTSEFSEEDSLYSASFCSYTDSDVSEPPESDLDNNEVTSPPAPLNKSEESLRPASSTRRDIDEAAEIIVSQAVNKSTTTVQTVKTNNTPSQTDAPLGHVEIEDLTPEETSPLPPALISPPLRDVDLQIILTSPAIFSTIKRFFQSLSDEQWRTVGEGVYNLDVKEQLQTMCSEVLAFVSESVTKKILQTIDLRSLVPTAPLTELCSITDANLQRNLQSCLSQALSNVVGQGVSITPDFTVAMAKAVISEVNAALSVAIQTSTDGQSPNIAVSNKSTATDTLEGAISTMKSFLTGWSATIKRRFPTDNGQLRGGCQHKAKSEPKTFFRGWQRKKVRPVQLSPVQEEVTSVTPDSTSQMTYVEQKSASPSLSTQSGDRDEDTSAQIPVDQSELTSESHQAEEPKTKMTNGFSRFVRNIFSKNNEKKRKTASAEKKTKRPPF